MNNSTEGVTLWVAFINDIITGVEKAGHDASEIKNMAEGLDFSSPFAYVPIQIYNDICQWVEANLGEETIIKMGFNIGETAYASLLENGVISDDADPEDVMSGIEVAAGSMINDPEGRGWDIIDVEDNYITMKRTQTFNSKLQFGVLEGLIQRSGKNNVKVEYLEEITKGAEFDVYKVSWEG